VTRDEQNAADGRFSTACKNVFFFGVSVIIIRGLTFGTMLTLLIVRVLYSVVFRLGPSTHDIRTGLRVPWKNGASRLQPNHPV